MVPNLDQCTSCIGYLLLENFQCQRACSSSSTPSGNRCAACTNCPSRCSIDCCPTGQFDYSYHCWSVCPNGTNASGNNCYKACTLNCPGSSFANFSNICQNCDPNCFTFDGGNKFNCLSCNINSFLYQSTCFSDECPLCDITCYSCSGGLSNNCISCETGLYLLNNECKVGCPPKFYQDTNTVFLPAKLDFI